MEPARDWRVPLITGQNIGVAWNKNRRSSTSGIQPVILLEDDMRPTAQRWEHVNLAGHLSKA